MLKSRPLVLLVMILIVALYAARSPEPLSAAGTSYYVDSASGSDGNSGTSSNAPWKTLTNVLNRHFLPGDTVNFKRGSTWTGELSIRDSGVQGNPITFRDYGTGAPPVISNPTTGPGKYVITISGSWVVVQGFLVKDSGDAGVQLANGANNNVVQNIEATNTGMGISIGGQYNLITNNYAHDLHMVVNTPGGDDDYGAEGFLVLNSNNEISYNRCINCRAPSYDYGYDGGVLEVFANGDNTYFHHNYGKGSDGFLEVGGAVARNVRVAFNVSDNNYTHFACLHVGGTFSSTINNLQIDNNTIVNTTASAWAVLNCVDAPITATQLLFRNNIVYTNTSIFNQSTFTHTNNIYYLLGTATVGFPLGSAERVVDPQFVDVNGGDYHLRSTSPAIDAGINLNYTLGVQTVSSSSVTTVDLGAYQYDGPVQDLTPTLYLPFVMR